MVPDVATLAAAPESAVVAEWAGLGYYRRARQLHAAARSLVQQGQGRLPRIPWLPLGVSIRDELEKILYSRAYAVTTIFACFVALTIIAVITTFYFAAG